MKIESIKITGIRSIDEFAAEGLGSIVIISGPNGSGKSSVLDAIRAFKASFATYVTNFELAGGRRQTFSFANVADDFPSLVSMSSGTTEVSAVIRLTPDEVRLLDCPKDILEGTVGFSADMPNTRPTLSGSDTEFLRALFGRLEAGLGTIEHIPADRRFSKEPMSNLSFDDNWALQSRLSRVDKTSGKFERLKWVLFQLDYMDAKALRAGETSPPQYMEGIRHIFGDFLDHKQLLGIEMSDNWAAPPRFPVRTPHGIHEIDDLSSGEKEILMTYSHLQRIKLSNSVILFDEPELHLHNTLVHRIICHIRGLAALGNQFWLSTQHPQIIRQVHLATEGLYYLPGGEVGHNVAWRATEEYHKNVMLEGLGLSIGDEITPNEMSLDEAIQQGECQCIEFMESYPLQARELAKEIAAFATSNPGNIFLGIRDDGVVIGLTSVDNLLDRDALLQRIEGSTRGTVKPAITVKVDFLNAEEGKSVCRIAVPKGTEPVYYVNNVPYVRHLTESRPAEPHEVENFVIHQLQQQSARNGLNYSNAANQHIKED